MNKNPSISVIGSYAVGMTISTPRFPVAGETVMGRHFSCMHGGKGSNQAVVAARMGANVIFGTCLGNDNFAKMCLDLHNQEKINAEFVRCSREGLATGVGLVIVNEDGENEIVIDFGANNEFSSRDVDLMMPEVEKTGLLLMQLEMNLKTTLYAAQQCHKKGIQFVLNPAPYQKLPEELLSLCDIITPNQTEARQLLGLPSDSPLPDEEIARSLHKLGVKTVIMTLGEDGAMIVSNDLDCKIPGIKVNAQDTTGAGDTFTGALCCALAEGKSMVEAVSFANVAAGLAVTKYGVIDSIPYRHEVDEMIQHMNRRDMK